MHEAESRAMEMLDMSAARARLGSCGDLLYQLAQQYCDESASVTHTLQALLHEGNLEVLTRELHTLKATSQSVGAEGVAAVARKAEQAARHGTPPDAMDLAAHVAAVTQALNSVQLPMRAWLDSAGH